ncbi:MAG: D-alanyl-D-alanine carboxypeptidase [Clostridia bacterium]|nr:D-alanyl-D-alanine carboxypeptidase [Clostridia bacterium]
MKRILAAALCVILCFSAALPAHGLSVSAEAAVLVCAESGAVLYEKNATRRLSMASTTKMMTALLALEACTPDREITVTREMVDVEGTSIGLQAGERVPLRVLIYGMLLASGNDAANAVAYALGGSPAAFAEMMNARAAALGMRDTHFVTPSGLDDAAHYSTAHDLALLACACIANPEFVAVCAAKTARLRYGDPPRTAIFSNHNRLLWRDDTVIGVKTGFTKKSGRCLVSAAQRDGLTFVGVTLNAPDDWEDHLALLDYGASVCKPVSLTFDTGGAAVRVFGGVRQTACVALAETPVYPADGGGYDCELLLRPYCYAPLAEGTVVGTAVFRSGGRQIAAVPVIAAERIERRAGLRQEPEPKGIRRLLRSISEFFD